jgi:hypothetical protein
MAAITEGTPRSIASPPEEAPIADYFTDQDGRTGRQDARRLSNTAPITTGLAQPTDYESFHPSLVYTRRRLRQLPGYRAFSRPLTVYFVARPSTMLSQGLLRPGWLRPRSCWPDLAY